MLLSIIIPAYNAETYIGTCLESVDLKSEEYEILVIDDGSQDDTASIVTKYQRKNPQIRYYYQENSGVSCARNNGMSRAEGTFLTFLDADDVFFPGTLRQMLSYLDKHRKRALYQFNYASINEEGKVMDVYEPAKKLHTPQEFKREFIKGYDLNTCWGKAYNTSVIAEHQLRFRTDMKIAEDVVFVAEYMKNVEEYDTMDLLLYGYRYYQDSVMGHSNQDISDSRIQDFVRELSCKRAFIEQDTTIPEGMALFVNKYKEVVVAMINIMMQSKNSLAHELERMDALCTHPQVQELLNRNEGKAQNSFSRNAAIGCLKSYLGRRMYGIGKHLSNRR